MHNNVNEFAQQFITPHFRQAIYVPASLNDPWSRALSYVAYLGVQTSHQGTFALSGLQKDVGGTSNAFLLINRQRYLECQRLLCNPESKYSPV